MNKVNSINKKLIIPIFVVITLGILLGYQVIDDNMFFFGLIATVGLTALSYLKNIEKTLMFMLLATSSMNIYKAFNRGDTRFNGTSPNFFTINIVNLIAFCFLVIMIIRFINLYKRLGKEKICNICIKHMKMPIAFVIVFIIYLIINTSIAVDSQVAIYEDIRLITYMIIFMYISFLGDFKRNRELYLNVLGYSLIIQLIIGIIQKIIGGSIGLYILGESEAVFRPAGGFYEKGMSGTMGHPALLALYTLFIFTMILFLKKNGKTKKVFLVIAVFIIIFCASRTVIVLTLIPTIIFAISKNSNILKVAQILVENIGGIRKKFKKKGNKVKIAVTTGIIILVVVVFSVIGRFVNSDFGKQVQNRLEHWNVAVGLIKDKPLLGYGANNYNFASRVLYKNWIKVDNKVLTKNSYVYGQRRGSTITVTFTGTSVELYGIKSPAGGIAGIYLDGKYLTDAHFYGYNYESTKIFEEANLKQGEHTLVIKVLGQRMIYSGGIDVSLDYVKINNEGKEQLFEDSSNKIVYSGNKVINYFYIVNPVHNVYLLYMVEFGTIGLIIILVFIYRCSKYSYKLLYRKDKVSRNAGRAFIAILIAYLLYNFTGWAGVKHQVLLLFLICGAFIRNIYITGFKAEEIG